MAHPPMGMPGATSLLPGCLQRLQVSLCSSLGVPAGNTPVKTYFQALCGFLLHQGPHLVNVGDRSVLYSAQGCLYRIKLSISRRGSMYTGLPARHCQPLSISFTCHAST